MRSKRKLMAKHVFNAHFVGTRISRSREQAQAKKGSCGHVAQLKVLKWSKVPAHKDPQQEA